MPWKLENFKGEAKFNYAADYQKSQVVEKKKKKEEEFLKNLEQSKERAKKAEEEAQKANSGVKMSLNRLLGLSKAPEQKPQITINENKIRSLQGPQNFGQAQFLPGVPDPILQEQSKTSEINKPMSLEQFRANPTEVSLKDTVKQGAKQFMESRKKIGDVLAGDQADQMINVGSMVDQRVGAVSAGKNFLKNIAKTELKELATAKDPRFIASFLKGRVAEESLPRVSETIAQMTSPDEVKGFLRTLDNAVPEESLSRLSEVLPPPSQETRPMNSLSRYVGRPAPELKQGGQLATPQSTELPVYRNPQELNKMDDDQVLEIGSKVLKEGEQNPENVGLFDRVKVALNNKFVKAQERLQDREVSVKRIISGESYGPVSVSNESDVAQKLELLPGRVDTRLREIQSETEAVIKDTAETAKKLGVTTEALQKDVDRYLIARHAPERNAIHKDGAAGITNEEASKVMKEMEDRADGAEIKRIAEGVAQMNRVTLDILMEGGVIGRKTYDQLKKAYPNHVPLNRILDDGDILEHLGASGGGRTMSVPSTGLMKAKGSNKEVSDILGNVQAMVSQAVVRVEKNRVMNSLLKFIEDNPQLDGIFEVKGRQAIGTRFDGVPIFKELKENQFVVKLGDESKVITINDTQLANVFNGVGVQQIPDVFKWVATYTRLKAGLATRFNVEFAPSNIIRDTQELAVYLSAQKQIGAKGAGKATVNIPVAMKGIVDSYRGIDSEWSKLYKQMKFDGGTTGGMALSTRGDIGLNIEKLRNLQGSNFKKSVKYVFEKIDDWNTIFEDSTRLAAYDTALKSGMTREQAAYIAKNSTINFNKHGNAGPVVNGLWMFANASIQGSAKMIKAMKNPKVATTVALTMGATTASVNRMNDSIDPEWRTKVTPWDRGSNIIVLLPSNEGIRYVTIPISWGLKPLKVMADSVDDFRTGHNKGGIGGFVKDFGTAVLEGYNPVGGGDFAQAVTPTIGDMPLDIARNKSWSGGLVRPDWMKLKSPEEQYFSSTANSASGRASIGAAKMLSDATGGVIRISPEDIKYAVTDLIGGPGRTITRLNDTIQAIASGKTPEAQDVPFSNRFFKNKTGEDLQKQQTSNENKSFFEQLKNYEDGSPEQKDFIRERLLELPDDATRKNFLLKMSSGGVDTKNLRSSEDMLKMEGTYQQIQDLLKGGKKDEATRLLNELPKDKQETYMDIRKSERAKRTSEFNKLLEKDPKSAVQFVRSQVPEEQQRLMKTLTTKEEQARYTQGKGE